MQETEIRVFAHELKSGRSALYFHRVMKEDGKLVREFEPVSVEDLFEDPSLIEEFKKAMNKKVLKA